MDKSRRHKEQCTHTVRHTYRRFSTEPCQCKSSDNSRGDIDEHHDRVVEVLAARDAGGVDDGPAVHEYTREKASRHDRHSNNDGFRPEDGKYLWSFGFGPTVLKNEFIII